MNHLVISADPLALYDILCGFVTPNVLIGGPVPVSPDSRLKHAGNDGLRTST